MMRKPTLLGLALMLLLSAIAFAQEATFNKIITGAIVTDGEYSYGASWGDYNNDGFLDLFVANGLNQNNFLYRNNGDNTFTKVNSGIIAIDLGSSSGGSWSDYDNDGDLDLFVTNDSNLGNFLYQNKGDGTFRKIRTGEIVTDGGRSLGSGWGDYDNDGDLDLFVANASGNNSLYQNNGDGTFRKITSGEIVNDNGVSQGSSWGDYDNDGDLDLFVANYFENNFLYQNNGDGSFQKITTSEIVTDGGRSRGGSWGDYDNDGDLDLFVTNDSNQNNFLYQNNGDGSFTRTFIGVIATDGGDSYGSSWGDYDNDGDLDLFVANWRDENNFLYQNNGDGTFQKITSGAIVTDGGRSQGSIWGDYDNDGDLDLFIANDTNQDNFLYENNGNNNSWIDIRLVGTISNPSAIGAKVKAKAVINGMPFWQMREISAQTGYLSQNSLNAEFGLGDATIIDSIKVEWPSGIVQDTSNVEIKRHLVIKEKIPIGVIKASFNGEPTEGASPLTVQFTDLSMSNPPITSWGWDFDNNGIIDSGAQNPSYTYSELGLYSVRLIISNGLNTDTLTRTNLINVKQFNRIEIGAIVTDGGCSSGGSWGDYDDDGNLDLFVTNSDENFLYRNNGDGTFQKITTGEIVSDGGSSRSSSWGDYDNDGNLDLFVANSLDDNNFLYRNKGDGTFQKITAGEIIGDGGESVGSSWGDYDNDGDLDLFVANSGDFISYGDENNFLYQNSGDGSFQKITSGEIVTDGGYSFGSSWGDYDNDGDLDLFVANDGNNFLYQNNGDGSFQKIASGAIVTDGGESWGSSWGDYDNDGDLDLFVANIFGDNFLYQNNGDGGFQKITSGEIVTDGGGSVGSSWCDYDNDGDLDLFVANVSDNNFLYQNNGDGSFQKITSGEIVTDGGYSFGSSWGDYDNDGDLDLFVANDGNNFLYQNNGNNNNWINIRLADTVSSSSAIGAKVKIKAVINGKPRWQMREISAQTGYNSENSLNAEFGLRDAIIIDSIKVEWPNGIVQDTAKVQVNQHLTIFEKITISRTNAGAIANDDGRSHGSSWCDYDNDGLLDLLVTNSGNNFLYQNKGDGNFQKVTSGEIVTDGGFSYSSSWGDYDNDGDLDLFVANSGNNFLYQNNGDGTFQKIITGDLVSDGGDSRGCSWGDYDNDGNLDLFVANDSNQDNFLYRNNGDGTFGKITTGNIVTDGGRSFGSSWGDYDNDGDLDLFVTNDFQDNFLYQNNGDGTFQKIIYGVIVNDRGFSYGSSWGDYDNDGDLDLFVTNAGSNFLYQNNGNGSFRKIRTGKIVSDLGAFRSSSWGDYDNDGDLDLFVATDSNQDNFLYQNNGDGTFDKITTGAIVTDDGSSQGSGWGDYDNDGDLDLFVANFNENNFLYENKSNNNNRINISLIGTVSNTSAIGAKVKVKTTARGASIWQMRELSGQTGYLSQSNLNAGFGLGRAVIIDSLRIEWPSRAVNGYANVAVNQFLTLRENNRPRFTRTIQDITVSLVGKDSVFDLNAAPTLFEDLDYDTLTYYALSSNDQIATASISGSVLKLTLISDKFPGRCQIKISADDSRVDDGLGNTEETSFEINRPPLLFRPIADQTLAVGDTSRRFVANLREVFFDPDGDVLAYDLNNSNTSAALVDTSGTVIFATPGDSTGEATITIVANDRRGGMLSTTFKINNAGLNTPPRLAGSGISDQMLIIAGRVFTQPLYEIFVDAEDDSLNFEARSSNRNVALAVVERDTLTVFPLTIGSTQISVAANDGNGGEVTTSFVVTVALSQAPQISHNPSAVPQPLNTPIVITSTITDDEGALSNASLYYRVAGRPNFEPPRGMQIEKVDTSTLRATGTIPGEAVTNQGVQYFIAANDNRFQSSRLPSAGVFAVRVRVDEGITNKRPQPSGDAQKSYHLFSIPLDVDNKSPHAVLEDDLGPQSIKRWRFFDIATDTVTGAVRNIEFPNTADMTPGKAFWLIIKDPNKFINTGPGTTVITSEPFAIALQKGWNFVGNPFNFPAFAEEALSNGQPAKLYAYEAGDWSLPFTPATRELQSFEGYAVYCSTACNMFINPNRFSSLGKSLPKTEKSTDEGVLWSIRIRAQCQEARDGNNLAAIVQAASRDLDRLDQPEPPVIGEYVSVYFPHREWHAPVGNTLAKTYCIDARPEPSNGDVWEFEVKTNIRDKVNLTFEGIDEIPKEFEVWLVDDALKTTQNLREQRQYAVAGASADHPKQLKLVVGKREFVDKKLAEARAIPTNYELSQNFPNPFNPATTIRYGLPKAERVTLKIYSLLGAEVATLVDDEQKPAGYHVAIWDGRDKNGRVVASGVYVYRMRAGDFAITKKMVLVR